MISAFFLNKVRNLSLEFILVAVIGDLSAFDEVQIGQLMKASTNVIGEEKSVEMKKTALKVAFAVRNKVKSAKLYANLKNALQVVQSGKLDTELEALVEEGLEVFDILI